MNEAFVTGDRLPVGEQDDALYVHVDDCLLSLLDTFDAARQNLLVTMQRTWGRPHYFHYSPQQSLLIQLYIRLLDDRHVWFDGVYLIDFFSVLLNQSLISTAKYFGEKLSEHGALCVLKILLFCPWRDSASRTNGAILQGF